MILLKRFILMIQFFTTIPIPINLKVNEKDFGRGLVFAPMVGLLIGSILAGFNKLLCGIFPVQITSAFTIVIYIMLTGGLHMDGLGDTFDGIFSNRSREKMLEIMRDSRVGTNAVLAVVCIILLDWLLIGQMKTENIMAALLLMPVTGRIGSLVGAGSAHYARAGEGLGKSFIDSCGIREIISGLVPAAAVFYIVSGLHGMLLFPLPVISAFLLVKFFGRKIGGITGDILGAVCEINQTIYLIAVFAFEAAGNR